MLNNMFSKESYRTFVKGISYEVPPILLVVMKSGVCKFVWSYDIIVFFSTFFGKFVCFSLPSMLICAYTLYYVVD